MTRVSKKAALLSLLILVYVFLFFYLITLQLRLDFISFYASADAYIIHLNPYQSVLPSFSPIKLPINLNPPFFLFLLSPLTHISFKSAVFLWSVLSFIAGILGALISFKLCVSPFNFKKYGLIFLAMYLSMYSTIMNLSIGQIGGFLLFFIMTGYYFYLKKQDYLAGFFWGIIIAIKLFPGLLIFLALIQKRYQLILIILITFILCWSMPLITHGTNVYSLYFDKIQRVLWYGDNWNSSIYGYLFRLFIDPTSIRNLIPIKATYLIVSVIFFIWYIKTIRTYNNTTYGDHRSFCLTLVMMLLLSPMGWLYYFSLLLMPLILLWQSTNENVLNFKKKIYWALSVFLINVPIYYVETKNMHHFILKISFYSLSFYGLILIAYLLSGLSVAPNPYLKVNNTMIRNTVNPVIISLTIGLLIILCHFVVYSAS